MAFHSENFRSDTYYFGLLLPDSLRQPDFKQYCHGNKCIRKINNKFNWAKPLKFTMSKIIGQPLSYCVFWLKIILTLHEVDGMFWERVACFCNKYFETLNLIISLWPQLELYSPLFTIFMASLVCSFCLMMMTNGTCLAKYLNFSLTLIGKW